MDYIAGNKNFKYTNCAVTLGKFDGIHLGHQQLLHQIISLKKQGYTSVMFTFMLHPGNLFSEKEFKLIYTEEEKLEKVKKSGMDVLISYPFTEETRSMEPEDFIKKILVEQLDTKVIVVGNDYRFGYQRRGDVKLLEKYADTYGYKVIAIEKSKHKDTIISSSAIRSAIKAGDMELANEMLGQPYHIRGEVIHGRKLGRTFGMPTTNMIPASSKLLPPYGVYTSKTLIDGIYYPGVTNIGFKPTVGEEKQVGIETYIFDYNADLYGKTIEVELYRFQRPELKFDTIDELILTMEKDKAEAQQYFGIES